MSSGSQDYYHSSRSQGARDDRSLPSIRDVVGEELKGRLGPNPYSFGDVRGALPSPHSRHTTSDSRHASSNSHHPSQDSDYRGPTLPPIRQSNHSASRSAGYSQAQGRHPTPAAHSHHHSPSEGYRGGGHVESGHIYGVLRASATVAGDLIHTTPPAGKPHGILRQGSTSYVTDQDQEKKHRCDYCGKGFDRPSSLEVHLRTHTGSQPFACGWPGCNRTFSVRSNMLRHWRSHEKNDASQHRDEEYDSDPREEQSSSRYFHAPSSSTQISSSQYYSSSRRK